jgi:hypothetical protein
MGFTTCLSGTDRRTAPLLGLDTCFGFARHSVGSCGLRRVRALAESAALHQAIRTIISYLLVGLLAVADAVDGNGIGGFVEQNPVVADAQPEQAGELAFERFHSAFTGIGVAVKSFQNAEGGLLFDSADLTGYAGVKMNFLHLFFQLPL